MSAERQARVVVAGLIAYGSLFPFDFASPASLGDAIRNALLGGWWTSRGDVLGNVALFVPFGLVWIWPSGRESSRVRRTLASALIFSVGLQVLQLWLPSRSAVTADVVWNMCGTAIGIALGLALPGLTATRGVRLGADRVVILALAGLWVLAELAPLIPSIDFEGIKGSLKPLLLHPRFDLVPALFEAAQVLLLGRLLVALVGPDRHARFLLGVLALVVAGKLVIVGQSLDWSLVIGFSIGAAAWIGWVSRLGVHQQTVALCATLVLTYSAAALSPFEWRAPPSSFAWMPFAGSLDGGMLANVRALSATAFVLAGAVWLIRRLPRSAWIASPLLAGWVLMLEILQRWISHRTPGSTEPLIVIAAMWLLAAFETGDSPPVVRSRVPTPPSSAGRYPARTRAAIWIAISMLVIAVAMKVLLSLPGIPYNVAGLFRHNGSLPVLLTFSLVLLWIGGGPACLSRQLARGPHPYLVLPIGIMAVSWVSFVLLTYSVTFESLADILGISHLFELVTTGNIWGGPARSLFLAINSPDLAGSIDHLVRYTALYSPLALALSLCLLALEPSKTISRWSWAAMLVFSFAWLWLARHLTIEWALTDNLTELIAIRAPLGVSGLPWLYCLALVLAGNVTVIVNSAEAGNRRLIAAVSCVGAIPLTWFLLLAGLEPRVEKYGATFSAVQFLLGPDREHGLSESVLFLRWSAVYLFLVVSTSAGAWLARGLMTRRAGLPLTGMRRSTASSNLPVIDAVQPPQPVPADAAGPAPARRPMMRPVPAPGRPPETAADSKPITRPVPREDGPAATRPKLIRRMPSRDPNRRDSH